MIIYAIVYCMVSAGVVGGGSCWFVGDRDYIFDSQVHCERAMKQMVGGLFHEEDAPLPPPWEFKGGRLTNGAMYYECRHRHMDVWEH
jgi:hypothetical protein